LPADRRIMVGTGPFTLAPGDSQTVVAIVAVGGLPSQGDRLSNLTRLRETVREARDEYRSGFASVPAAPACDARLAWTSARPNPARDLQRIELVVGDDVRRLEVRVHDLAGRRIWSRTILGPRPGRLTIDWNGADDDGHAVPAGIYLVRVEDGRRRAAGKIVRLR
jgi:flagellar hook capping protein FlgD